MLVSIHQVPINVLDLRNRRDHLQFESFIGDLAVVVRNADKTRVRQQPEALQQVLANRRAEVGGYCRLQTGEDRIGGRPLIVEAHGEVFTELEALRIIEVCRGGVLLQRRRTGGDDVR